MTSTSDKSNSRRISGAKGRRRSVVDPKTMQPVNSPLAVSNNSATEQDEAKQQQTAEQNLASVAGYGRKKLKSGKIDTSLLDRLEERDLIARHNRRIHLAGAAGAIGAALILSAVVFVSPLFAYDIEECAVSGNHSLPSATICDATKRYVGTPVTRMQVNTVEKQILQAVPQLDAVEVSRSPLHGISLHVVERVPVATVRRGGKIVGVDREGVVLEVAPGAVVELPSLDVDLEALGGKTQQLVDSALEVFGDMPAELRVQVEKVTSDDPGQLSFMLRDGRSLIWGDVTDSIEKAQVAKILFTVEGAKLVDVSSPERPSTR